MEEKRKKPIYKRWWFWLLIVILIIALSNCGNDETQVENNNTANENEETENNETNETEQKETNNGNETEKDETEIEEKAGRDNTSAKETTLNAGKFTVGTDIPPGRYVITGDSNGNLFVYENGLPVVNEILDPTGGFGVTSVTTDIAEGQEIEISGINSVKFTPAETKLLTTLTTGTWEVGLDIAEGRYDVTAPSGSGNFFVYNTLGLPEVNEILDATGEFGVPKLTVNLENGQTVSIGGLEKAEFTAK